MNQELQDNNWQSILPNESQSTTDFIASMSQSVVKEMDLVTAAPKEAVLAKANTIKASQISGARENLTRYYPVIDEMFAGAFTSALEKLVTSSEVNAAQLSQAYASAVYFVRDQTTKQFSQLMFMPDAVGNFFDHFDVPVDPEIVKDLETSNPTLATEYKDRAKRWIEGT